MSYDSEIRQTTERSQPTLPQRQPILERSIFEPTRNLFSFSFTADQRLNGRFPSRKPAHEKSSWGQDVASNRKLSKTPRAAAGIPLVAFLEVLWRALICLTFEVIFSFGKVVVLAMGDGQAGTCGTVS
jgi:hypothetical protein